jgi:hypothetical protein
VYKCTVVLVVGGATFGSALLFCKGGQYHWAIIPVIVGAISLAYLDAHWRLESEFERR